MPKEHPMTMLLLDRAQLEVKAEGDTLALYEARVRRGTVPIKLIERCVVHGAQTVFTSGVLLKLAEAGVTTVFMSPRQTRRVAMVLGPQHDDAAVRLAQAHRVMDDTACRQWAHSLVAAKLQRQQRALQHLVRQHPRCPQTPVGCTANSGTRSPGQPGQRPRAAPTSPCRLTPCAAKKAQPPGPTLPGWQA